jgi:hypothetical protein
VHDEGPSGSRLVDRFWVNPYVEAMTVEFLVGAVDGKMADGAGLAKGIQVEIGLLGGDPPDVAQRG